MMRNNNLITIEILLVSTYCRIIKNILIEHKELSLVKLITFAFLIKKNKFLDMKIYTNRNKYDVTEKFLSQLSGQFKYFVKDIRFLLEAIDILKKNNSVFIESDVVFFRDISMSAKDKESDFIFRAINNSKNMSDEQFMREVMSYV